MKKKLLLVTMSLMLALGMTACSKTSEEPAAEKEKTEAAAEEKKTEAVAEEDTTEAAAEKDEVSEEPEDSKKELPKAENSGSVSGEGGEGGSTYKSQMVPFEQLNHSNRIVVLQNTLRYLADGFYTEETKPAAEEIEYGGETVSAYPITYAIDFLTYGSADTVFVTDTEGEVTEMSAEEFAVMYAIVDFRSEEAPILYNPETETEIAFQYATTSEGEAIYSIASGSSHKCVEIAEACGWDTEKTQNYRLMAVDQFYIPVSFAENPDGELRGTLSGSIGASIPDFKIAGGKINDVVYIELIAE